MSLNGRNSWQDHLEEELERTYQSDYVLRGQTARGDYIVDLLPNPTEWLTGGDLLDWRELEGSGPVWLYGPTGFRRFEIAESIYIVLRLKYRGIGPLDTDLWGFQ